MRRAPPLGLGVRSTLPRGWNNAGHFCIKGVKRKCRAPCDGTLFSETQPCTRTQDRTCYFCGTGCKPGTYESQKCSIGTNRTCAKCSKDTCASKGKGWFTKKPCTIVNDVICATCDDENFLAMRPKGQYTFDKKLSTAKLDAGSSKCKNYNKGALASGDFGQMNCQWKRVNLQLRIAQKDLPVAISFKCDSNDNIHAGFDSAKSPSGSSYNMPYGNIECQNGKVYLDFFGTRK